jgi:hypothetical protein
MFRITKVSVACVAFVAPFLGSRELVAARG